MDIDAKRIEVLERETRIKERELELKEKEAGRAAWRSPLVVSIFAAALAAASNAWIAFYNSEVNRRDQNLAAENARILQMLKADPEQAARNLEFLIDTNLITDAALRKNVRAYLATRKPGVGPSLAPPPSPGSHEQLLEGLSEALATEIKEGVVTIGLLGSNFVMVRFSNRLLFPAGEVETAESFNQTTLLRLSSVLEDYTKQINEAGFKPGRLIIVGHSDGQQLPVASPWDSNHEFSEARAQSLADNLLSKLTGQHRTIVEGRGPDDPICGPPEDRDCWAVNRRVEILIERVL